MKRRTCLGALGVASIGGVSGCLGGSSDSRSSGPYSDVTLQPSVSHPASETNPARISFDLINEGSQQVEIYPLSRGGRPLEWIGELEGETSRVKLFPVETSHVRVIDGELPRERRSGCWRYPPEDELLVGIDDLKFSVSLAHEERFSVPHDLYFDGADDRCFPDDEYEDTVGVEYEANGTTVQAEFTLSVAPPPDAAVEVANSSFEESG